MPIQFVGDAMCNHCSVVDDEDGTKKGSLQFMLCIYFIEIECCVV